MPEQKKIIVFFEGDDDKAFLEKLQDAGLLPAGCQLAIRNKDQHPGKDGLIRQLLPVISPVNGIEGRAVVLVDLDDLTPQKRVEWFQAELSAALQHDERYKPVTLVPGAQKGLVCGFRLVAQEKVGHVAIVPVGCPDDAPFNTKYQIDRFALDDWVFRLALDPKVFANVSDLHTVQYDIALRKYEEIAQVLRANGLEARKTKTYVQILRLLADIRPATATIVGRLVKKGFDALGEQEFVKLIRPLLDDLADAAMLVSAE